MPQLTEPDASGGVWNLRCGRRFRWTSRFTVALLIVSFAWSLTAVADAQDPAAQKSEPAAQNNDVFEVANGLTWQRVLSEPDVRQPVFCTFDARGRLWVLQYLQYPDPAGLKLVARDNWWRAVYDAVPLPPPHGVRGADKITIHEDTDGDGVYDTHKTFVDGLNIATSFAFGRGGVWVLNPPYLLFYADKNRDDIPDGDPEVHLQGFGLEDTHSVVNSLCWGPDGWLYAAQGSTVTGHVSKYVDKVKQNSDSVTATNADVNAEAAVHSLGQNIWRYHPETRRYEIFAEGGGNAFGVEIDSSGRIFSGHNGGDTRGFAYVQGGYFQKGFNKHGPLSNPYAFGYFPAMKHPATPRFTHNFVIYEGGSFPAEYRGKLFGVAPLLHHVVISDLFPDGSSVQTRDLGFAANSRDPKFVPVDIKLGPDGALYVADWYDEQCAHTQSYQGRIDKSNGRIYRLQGAAFDVMAARKSPHTFDIETESSAELVERLSHPNRWHRSVSLRVLWDRRDTTVLPLLRDRLASAAGNDATWFLWGISASGGFDEPTAIAAFQHAEPNIRQWSVRMLGDDVRLPGGELNERSKQALIQLTASETDVHVRSQLASTARRVDAKTALAIVRGLVAHDADASDIHLPLLIWWGVEAQVATAADDVVNLFRDTTFWQRAIVQRTLAERTMRRFAVAGRSEDWKRCETLFSLAPNQEDRDRLLAGVEAALIGRPLPELPAVISTAMAARATHSIPLGLRRRDPAAIRTALREILDQNIDAEKRVSYIHLLGEVEIEKAAEVLCELIRTDSNPAIRQAAASSLLRYNDAAIPGVLVAALSKVELTERGAIVDVLAGRRTWTTKLLDELSSGRLSKELVPADIARPLLRHRGDEIRSQMAAIWPELKSPDAASVQESIDRVQGILNAGEGVPRRGKPLFAVQCASCHRLFGSGADVGPDLTPYQRDQLDALLLAIVHPSAEIREGFNQFYVSTKDGRTLAGFLVEEDPKRIVLRGRDARDVSVPRNEIEELIATDVSLMPQGLLNGLTDEQIRDLISYLRMSQPLTE